MLVTENERPTDHEMRIMEQDHTHRRAVQTDGERCAHRYVGTCFILVSCTVGLELEPFALGDGTIQPAEAPVCTCGWEGGVTLTNANPCL